MASAATDAPHNGHAMGEGAGVSNCALRSCSLALPPAQRDDRRSAASTVLLRSMARVVGPTPPRRGVIQDATSATDSSTSGITRRPSYVAPALTTAAPGLTMSGVAMPAWPAATTRMSAVRVYSPRSPTPVCTTVTAALAFGRLRL